MHTFGFFSRQVRRWRHLAQCPLPWDLPLVLYYFCVHNGRETLDTFYFFYMDQCLYVDWCSCCLLLFIDLSLSVFDGRMDLLIGWTHTACRSVCLTAHGPWLASPKEVMSIFVWNVLGSLFFTWWRWKDWNVVAPHWASKRLFCSMSSLLSNTALKKINK